MILKELLNKYNINGSELKGTDKDTKHSYLDIYQSLFDSIKNKNLSILEIGIQFGASSLLWQEYFVNSKLTLIDIEYQLTEDIKSKLSKDRCDLIIFDAYDDVNFKTLEDKKFDIIFDDGPHTLESQIFVVNNYTKLLSENGILIIEDIQVFNDTEKLKKLLGSNFDVEIIDLRHIKNRYDDVLFIAKKNNNNQC